MKRISWNGNFIEMHDSIDEMPILVFQAYNRYALIDAEIGGDIDSVNSHYSKLSRYASEGDTASLDKELMNYYQNLIYIIEYVNPEMMSFGALVHSVNGKPVGQLTEDGIRRLLETLSKKGLTLGKVRGYMDYVKKKLKRTLRHSFRKAETPQSSTSTSAS